MFGGKVPRHYITGKLIFLVSPLEWELHWDRSARPIPGQEQRLSEADGEGKPGYHDLQKSKQRVLFTHWTSSSSK